MVSPIGGAAINDALEQGKALLKFISPNDVGTTGSHQCGFYLPKAAWEIFTPYAPIKGENSKSWPTILWQDGRETASCVTWYGTGTRSEYRLTRFGPDFPYLTADTIGNLLVLIPRSHDDFLAYVLDLEEDIIEIQAALGVEVIGSWGIYEAGKMPDPESENECIDRQFRKFAEQLTAFPPTKEFSYSTQQIVAECVKQFAQLSIDEKLMRCISEEYSLFRMVERKITQPEIVRVFKDVDDFIETAASIMNRRKARAGRSLEHHMEKLFLEAKIPFEAQAKIDGKVQPDILIPGKAAYEDPSYPVDKLFIVGLKTTCKDRWRQVLNEGKRIQNKHLLTMQQGISANQLQEMKAANLTLIVPQKLHKDYPSNSGVEILTIEKFVSTVRQVIPSNV